MSVYLLDTNILSDLLRYETGRTAQMIGALGADSVCTSIVVAAELRFGAARKGSPRLSAEVEDLLARLTVLPLEAPADRHYAEIQHYLQRAGTPIGGNDLLIAAHARAKGSILVTDNMGEFERVPDLRIENWLR